MTHVENLRVEKALPALPTRDIAPLRRFELADFNRHSWIVKRLQKANPEISEQYAAGWLRGLIYSNDFCFRYQDHAVGLANLVRSHALQTRAMVVEKFVFAEDPQNPKHIEAAAQMYDQFVSWAKSLDADRIIVEQLTDVPHDLIKERLGRMMEVKQWVARVE